jgi:hypothetical protein
MLYPGIYQHARQGTISMRNDGGDVVMARQISTRSGALAYSPRERASVTSTEVPTNFAGISPLLSGRGPNEHCHPCRSGPFSREFESLISETAIWDREPREKPQVNRSQSSGRIRRILEIHRRTAILRGEVGCRSSEKPRIFGTVGQSPKEKISVTAGSRPPVCVFVSRPNQWIRIHCRSGTAPPMPVKCPAR